MLTSHSFCSQTHSLTWLLYWLVLNLTHMILFSQSKVFVFYSQSTGKTLKNPRHPSAVIAPLFCRQLLWFLGGTIISAIKIGIEEHSVENKNHKILLSLHLNHIPRMKSHWFWFAELFSFAEPLNKPCPMGVWVWILLSQVDLHL